MCDDCDELRERIAALEETVESLIEYRGEKEVLRNLWIDGQPVGIAADSAGDKANKAKQLAEDALEAVDAGGANTHVSAQAREVMLPAHRMWADLRDGQRDALSKGQRRAGTIFGAFLHRAGGTDAAEAPVPIGPIDASGQTYSLTSTNAKQLLQSAPHLDFEGEIYPQTVKRIFHDVQRFTKAGECDCDSIDFCDHGLLQCDSSQGTNVLAVNKQRFNTALKNVQARVEGRSAVDPDDSVSPETGRDEGAADALVAEADAELDRLDEGASNIVVSRAEGNSVRSASTNGR